MALVVGISNPCMGMTCASWMLLPGVRLLGMLPVSEPTRRRDSTMPLPIHAFGRELRSPSVRSRQEGKT